MMIHLLVLLTTLTLPAIGAELKLSSATYEEAEKADTYFKFIGHSRKLGIIGTSFEGYAKQATLSFERKGETLVGLRLRIPVAALDTDSNSRNEKMRDTCLSEKEFPEIAIRLLEPVAVNAEQQELAGEMRVRGERVPLRLRVHREGGDTYKGESSFKLSDAKIPDPSIAIASVRDEFELEFRVKTGAAK